MPPPESDESGSRRWVHFSSALQLAIQRASYKWTYEDFRECFPLWCKESPEGGRDMYRIVSQHMESTIQKNCESLLDGLDIKAAIDNLHTVVMEAQARAESGVKGPDVWYDALEPWGAARARTVPVLQRETDRLKAQLEQLENDNRDLQKQMQENVRARDEADAKIFELLNNLKEVYTQWGTLPYDDIAVWGVDAREKLKPIQP